MTNKSKSSAKRTPVWVAVGAIFLVILLILWLTFADLAGDTDVAAYVMPYVSNTYLSAL